MAAYNVGDWVWTEDGFAQVECVWKVYCEEFDDSVACGERMVGEYANTVVTLRTFCGRRGGLKKGRAWTVYDFADWVRPVTDEERSFIEKVIAKDTGACRQWLGHRLPVRDYVDVCVSVKEGTARAELAKLKKAVKLDELLEQGKAAGFNLKIGEAEQPGDPYVSFTLRYNVGESRGRRRLFCGVKDLDYTEPKDDEAVFERLITFEGVFILLGQTVKMYDTQHPSAGNKELLERLGSVFNALLNHDWKACPVAKDYYRHAPKLVSYSFEQAWNTITGFLERNADGLGAHAFLVAISESDEVENVCHRIYNASVGL